MPHAGPNTQARATLLTRSASAPGRGVFFRPTRPKRAQPDQSTPKNRANTNFSLPAPVPTLTPINDRPCVTCARAGTTPRPCIYRTFRHVRSALQAKQTGSPSTPGCPPTPLTRSCIPLARMDRKTIPAHPGKVPGKRPGKLPRELPGVVRISERHPLGAGALIAVDTGIYPRTKRHPGAHQRDVARPGTSRMSCRHRHSQLFLRVGDFLAAPGRSVRTAPGDYHRATEA